MSKKIETIVVATSLSTESDAVVEAGLSLARATRARVVLVHAHSSQAVYAGAPFAPDVTLGEVLEAESLAVRRQMTNQADRLGLHAEELAGMIVEPGPAHSLIVDVAERKGADLIVLGATESPRLSKLFGSTADRVVRKATCPVLMVRQRLAVPPRRALLPIDLSFLSGEAVRGGMQIVAELASDLGQATSPPVMEVFYVITDLDRRLFAKPDAPEEAEAHIREEVGRFLGRYAVDSPLKVVTKLASGLVEEEVLARIREWQPDLVVIGTHGRSGFERFLLGSVASQVLRDGGVNVLVVPPAVARRQAGAEAAVREEVMVG